MLQRKEDNSKLTLWLFQNYIQSMIEWIFLAFNYLLINDARTKRVWNDVLLYIFPLERACVLCCILSRSSLYNVFKPNEFLVLPLSSYCGLELMMNTAFNLCPHSNFQPKSQYVVFTIIFFLKSPSYWTNKPTSQLINQLGPLINRKLMHIWHQYST